MEQIKTLTLAKLTKVTFVSFPIEKGKIIEIQNEKTNRLRIYIYEKKDKIIVKDSYNIIYKATKNQYIKDLENESPYLMSILLGQ